MLFIFYPLSNTSIGKDPLSFVGDLVQQTALPLSSVCCSAPLSLWWKPFLHVKFEHPMFIFQSLASLLTAVHLQKEPVSSPPAGWQIATQKHLLPSLKKFLNFSSKGQCSKRAPLLMELNILWPSSSRPCQKASNIHFSWKWRLFSTGRILKYSSVMTKSYSIETICGLGTVFVGRWQ